MKFAFSYSRGAREVAVAEDWQDHRRVSSDKCFFCRLRLVWVLTRATSDMC